MKYWYEGIGDRYKQLDSASQILNVISDLIKASRFVEKDLNLVKRHIYGALVLLDYMIEDVKWRDRLKELLRFREAVCSLLTDRPYGTFDNIIRAGIMLDAEAYKILKNVR
ncbi:MAG: hypothetical protein H0Z29_08565 [Candidatus Marinimicrobia bacterium]|nr:hypothetical protein [Candidatus Neomarinimicrobiota bacterium]